MTAADLIRQLAEAGETIRTLHEELAETNRGLVALSMELEQRVEQRTAELAAANESLCAEILQRKQAHARLQLAASVFSHAREGIIIADPTGRIVDVNEAFTRITGYGREEAIGQNPRILKSGRRSPEFYRAMWDSLLNEGHWTGEIWDRRKHGEVFAQILTISAVQDEQGATQHYVGLFSDITAIKEHERELERIAHFDALTSLPNRVLLADRLKHAIRRCERHDLSLLVVYLDLDGFKVVNDTHGHEVGDTLLVAVAKRMRDALREGDTLSRIGGDEFVAVIEDIDSVHVSEIVLDRLLRAAAEPITIDGLTLQVSASIGVARFPQDATDADQLIRDADQAMYQAKRDGKNRYQMFGSSAEAAVQTTLHAIERIRLGLERNEFVLHYQPKVNFRTRRVVGAEGLIRWQHPERGLLLPDSFLSPTCHPTVCSTLGEWVITAALAQMVAWRAAGLHIPVSVNVEVRHLQQPDFPARLARLLAAHPGVLPSSLELEILETSVATDLVTVSGVMRGCRELGVGFALDDFGTGYSSLTYLKYLPADLLKIDRSFVRDMLHQPDDRAIIKGVVALASGFNRKVIAEGVESAEQASMLLDLGCDLIQGFAIARPMLADEMPGWLESWK